jgi:hypothetical protein
MPATRNVDEVGARLQYGKRLAVQDAFGLRRERQQVHKYAAGLEKAVKALLTSVITAVAGHAGYVFGTAAPAVHRKVEHAERLWHRRAPSTPRPMTPMGKSLRARGLRYDQRRSVMSAA